mmetsp:Transcript_10319/g.30202  ORF Transcript_10319/g.30202 Transcript_10319/m.30202 type:complete len:754 (+) Transcript_10319:165-2426(+)
MSLSPDPIKSEGMTTTSESLPASASGLAPDVAPAPPAPAPAPVQVPPPVPASASIATADVIPAPASAPAYIATSSLDQPTRTASNDVGESKTTSLPREANMKDNSVKSSAIPSIVAPVVMDFPSGGAQGVRERKHALSPLRDKEYTVAPLSSTIPHAYSTSSKAAYFRRRGRSVPNMGTKVVLGLAFILVVSWMQTSTPQLDNSLENTQPMSIGSHVSNPSGAVENQVIDQDAQKENGHTNPETTQGLVESTPSSPESKQHELYLAAREEFKTESWKNPSTFTFVSRSMFKELARKAHEAAASMVEDVYTKCELYLMPPERQNTDASDKMDTKPLVKFRCLKNRSDGKDVPLQDEICHTVNMCKVVLNLEAWQEELAGSSGFSQTGFTYTKDEMATKAKNKRKYTEKSALLMMVDSVEYMTQNGVFEATINKASYAFRSNRPFYIWIGKLDQTELNRREVESVGAVLGAKCATQELENSMHFYKPIAFLVLMNILSNADSSFFFMDADSDFTKTAFERLDSKSNDGIGPETYLELSPQASLVAAQNVKGKMLINSGLMVVRNTGWAKDLSAIWWFTRCGYKDQLALWLVLFATFSAWTTDINSNITVDEHSGQFGYPAQIFYSYEAASKKNFLFFRKHGHAIQTAWESLVERQRNSKESNEKAGSVYDLPIPTNTKLFNGGSYPGMKPKLSMPLELPHVMILPQAPIQHQFDQVTESTLELPRFKSDDGNSFVLHSKILVSCSDGRCWPYMKG